MPVSKMIRAQTLSQWEDREWPPQASTDARVVLASKTLHVHSDVLRSRWQFFDSKARFAELIGQKDIAVEIPQESETLETLVKLLYRPSYVGQMCDLSVIRSLMATANAFAAPEMLRTLADRYVAVCDSSPEELIKDTQFLDEFLPLYIDEEHGSEYLASCRLTYVVSEYLQRELHSMSAVIVLACIDNLQRRGRFESANTPYAVMCSWLAGKETVVPPVILSAFRSRAKLHKLDLNYLHDIICAGRGNTRLHDIQHVIDAHGEVLVSRALQLQRRRRRKLRKQPKEHCFTVSIKTLERRRALRFADKVFDGYLWSLRPYGNTRATVVPFLPPAIFESDDDAPCTVESIKCTVAFSQSIEIRSGSEMAVTITKQ